MKYNTIELSRIYDICRDIIYVSISKYKVIELRIEECEFDPSTDFFTCYMSSEKYTVSDKISKSSKLSIVYSIDKEEANKLIKNKMTKFNREYVEYVEIELDRIIEITNPYIYIMISNELAIPIFIESCHFTEGSNLFKHALQQGFYRIAEKDPNGTYPYIDTICKDTAYMYLDTGCSLTASEVKERAEDRDKRLGNID